MFLEHFGLREQPFGVTPDPRFLYLSGTHREALASLYYGIESGRGFFALIAKPGAGKSTLLFYLLERLQDIARTAFIFQTQCSPREFMRSLMSDLGVGGADEDVAAMQARLNEVLMQEARRGKRFLLVVDEAQGLSDAVLETVRMLSNFETPTAKLMQILLAGQPELAARLASPGLVQLRQRISIVCRLKPLTCAETSEYVTHRLRLAGGGNGNLFAPEALAEIHRLSEGMPRNINNLCFHALTLAFAKGRKSIDPSMVEEIRSDLDLESISRGDSAPLEADALSEPSPVPMAAEAISPQLDELYTVASLEPDAPQPSRVTTETTGEIRRSNPPHTRRAICRSNKARGRIISWLSANLLYLLRPSQPLGRAGDSVWFLFCFFFARLTSEAPTRKILCRECGSDQAGRPTDACSGETACHDHLRSTVRAPPQHERKASCVRRNWSSVCHAFRT